MIGDLESCNFFADKFCVTHNQPEKKCRKKAVDEWDLLRLKYESLLSHFREGFGKHGFILHPGLTPEENAKEWADERDKQLRLNDELKRQLQEAERVATKFKSLLIARRAMEPKHSREDHECPECEAIAGSVNQQTEKRVASLPKRDPEDLFNSTNRGFGDYPSAPVVKVCNHGPMEMCKNCDIL